MPLVMWLGCSSKLNASSGSNQKGHSVGGRRREPLWKRLKDCTHIWRVHTNTQSCWFRKKCPSVITLNSLNASQVTAKPRFCALYHTKWTGSIEYGTRVKTNVPFCYFKYTMALVCFGVCTTIMTLQCTCFKQPSRWRVCHVWHTSTKCTLFQWRLIFQASSSTCESKIWMMIEGSRCGFHMPFIICCL